ncbi:hypothetical protein [Treponema sp. R6D11]
MKTFEQIQLANAAEMERRRLICAEQGYKQIVEMGDIFDQPSREIDFSSQEAMTYKQRMELADAWRKSSEAACAEIGYKEMRAQLLSDYQL